MQVLVALGMFGLVGCREDFELVKGGWYDVASDCPGAALANGTIYIPDSPEVIASDSSQRAYLVDNLLDYGFPENLLRVVGPSRLSSAGVNRECSAMTFQYSRTHLIFGCDNLITSRLECSVFLTEYVAPAGTAGTDASVNFASANFGTRYHVSFREDGGYLTYEASFEDFNSNYYLTIPEGGAVVANGTEVAYNEYRRGSDLPYYVTTNVGAAYTEDHTFVLTIPNSAIYTSILPLKQVSLDVGNTTTSASRANSYTISWQAAEISATVADTDKIEVWLSQQDGNTSRATSLVEGSVATNQITISAAEMSNLRTSAAANLYLRRTKTLEFNTVGSQGGIATITYTSAPYTITITE